MEEKMCLAAIEGGDEAVDEIFTNTAAAAMTDLRILYGLLTSGCIQAIRGTDWGKRDTLILPIRS
jgi:hypothetical protein